MPIGRRERKPDAFRRSTVPIFSSAKRWPTMRSPRRSSILRRSLGVRLEEPLFGHTRELADDLRDLLRAHLFLTTAPRARAGEVEDLHCFVGQGLVREIAHAPRDRLRDRIFAEGATVMLFEQRCDPIVASIASSAESSVTSIGVKQRPSPDPRRSCGDNLAPTSRRCTRAHRVRARASTRSPLRRPRRGRRACAPRRRRRGSFEVGFHSAPSRLRLSAA